VLDEIPVVGEAKAIYEGDPIGFFLGLIPGGKKIMQGVEKFAKIDQKALQRGRKSEKRVLASEGLEKNTKTFSATDPKTGKTKNTIPDAIDGGQTVEVKDVKILSDSPQLRAQSVISGESGQKARVITGTDTKVSKTVRKRMEVETRDDLGPN